MQFTPTKLQDAYIVALQPILDERGFFARTFCRDAFAEHGLQVEYPQHSMSFSRRRGTLRGLHYQLAPHEEAKLIRCTRGEIFDVIVDLRPDSASYRRWQSFELSSQNGRQLYVPAGFAHGFQTLCDDVEVNYLISARYKPEYAAGIRYDDPALGIGWPLSIAEISERDLSWPPISKTGR